MAQGLVPVAAGITIGLAIAAGAGQLIATMLYGVTPTDGMTYGAVLGSMMLSATLACLLPARRAMRVQPASALRS
jgi:ABC-type lipoprotein release transport system permease subunit